MVFSSVFIRACPWFNSFNCRLMLICGDFESAFMLTRAAMSAHGAQESQVLSIHHFEPSIGEVEGAFDIVRQPEAQEGLVLERGADFKLKAVFLPLIG